MSSPGGGGTAAPSRLPASREGPLAALLRLGGVARTASPASRRPPGARGRGRHVERGRFSEGAYAAVAAQPLAGPRPAPHADSGARAARLCAYAADVTSSCGTWTEEQGEAAGASIGPAGTAGGAAGPARRRGRYAAGAGMAGRGDGGRRRGLSAGAGKLCVLGRGRRGGCGRAALAGAALRDGGGPGRAARGARGPYGGARRLWVCGDLGYPAPLAPHMEGLVQADARRLGGPLPVQGTCLGVGLPWLVTGHALTSGACGCRSPWPARPSRSSLKARPPSIGPPPRAGCVQDACRMARGL